MRKAFVVMAALAVFLFAADIEIGTEGIAAGYPFGC